MQSQKRHIVTLSFDDGFRKSSIRTAEIFEKHGLSACLNVIATAHHEDYVPPDPYQRHPVGDFVLWNELQARGHEIMPHGYKHVNLRELPFAESQDLIRRCLETFAIELDEFAPKSAIYNFAYLASTPELEAWLPTQVRAFRTGYDAINLWPHAERTKLTCTTAGPENCEAVLDLAIDDLLSRDQGWLIFCAHGLDGEGYGPMGAAYLDRLLARLTESETVDVLPAGAALRKYVGEP